MDQEGELYILFRVCGFWERRLVQSLCLQTEAFVILFIYFFNFVYRTTVYGVLSIIQRVYFIFPFLCLIGLCARS